MRTTPLASPRPHAPQASASCTPNSAPRDLARFCAPHISTAHLPAVQHVPPCRNFKSRSRTLARSLPHQPLLSLDGWTVGWTTRCDTRVIALGRLVCTVVGDMQITKNSREDGTSAVPIATISTSLRNVEILEVGLRRPVVDRHHRHAGGSGGEIYLETLDAETISVKQLVLAAAALRAQSFYDAPTVDETGVFLLGECAEKAYERWFLNCCKAEQARTLQMDRLGMQVVCLVAMIPAESLVGILDEDDRSSSSSSSALSSLSSETSHSTVPPKECRLLVDRCAVGTLNMHLGVDLPGELLEGDRPHPLEVQQAELP
eukprot:CAMPEP_0198226598 /NCGR_PEP_ID=MMETSP1445-20131203/105862_1 /TAXON_ID=36898 /ORGANISM="Pyramimonas sp., Strain CCMP2087" /LENGTH=316 /DNA_ID=CAMNT_0043906431 /DNA_START=344 /DNA_END=1290 /DNA_ORIENTATION=-